MIDLARKKKSDESLPALLLRKIHGEGRVLRDFPITSREQNILEVPQRCLAESLTYPPGAADASTFEATLSLAATSIASRIEEALLRTKPYIPYTRPMMNGVRVVEASAHFQNLAPTGSLRWNPSTRELSVRSPANHRFGAPTKIWGRGCFVVSGYQHRSWLVVEVEEALLSSANVAHEVALCSLDSSSYMNGLSDLANTRLSANQQKLSFDHIDQVLAMVSTSSCRRDQRLVMSSSALSFLKRQSKRFKASKFAWPSGRDGFFSYDGVKILNSKAMVERGPAFNHLWACSVDQRRGVTFVLTKASMMDGCPKMAVDGVGIFGTSNPGVDRIELRGNFMVNEENAVAELHNFVDNPLNGSDQARHLLVNESIAGLSTK